MAPRNFHGCWTCRSRKVKCDLSKPKCKRCVKANFECAGYGIKLGWSSPYTINKNNQMVVDKSGITTAEVESNKNSRRHISIVSFPVDAFFTTYDDLDNALNSIDEWCENTQYKSMDSFSIGPFTVNRVFGGSNTLKRTYLESTTTPTSSDLSSSKKSTLFNVGGNNDNDFGNGKNAGNPIPDSNKSVKKLQKKSDISSGSNLLQIPILRDSLSHSSILFNQNNRWVHSSLLKYATLTSLTLKGVNYKLTEQSLLHILYPKFFPNIDSDDWEADVNVLNKLFIFTNEGVTVSPLFNKLLNAYKSKVCLFQRVSHQTSYWQKAIIPTIYKISEEFMNTGHKISIPVWEENWSFDNKLVALKSCIVYTILSLSAFQFASLKTNTTNDEILEVDEYMRISIELRKLSMKYLNFHLDCYGDDEDDIEDTIGHNQVNTLEYYELLLLQIVLMISVDTYFSVFEDYDGLYGVGEDILRHRLTTKKKSLRASTLYIMALFDYLHTFYMSTKAIKSFNYSIVDDSFYGDVKEDYNLFVKPVGVESESDYEDDEEEQEGGEGRGKENDQETEFERNSKLTGNKTKRHISIKPSISNLLSNEKDAQNSRISFTIDFAGSASKILNGIPDKGDTVKNNQKQNAYIPDPDEMGFNHFNSDSFYISYGIPQSLIELFKKCVQFANDKNVFNREKKFPRNFPKLCAELEDTLLSWDYSDYWTLKVNGHFISDYHEGIYHNIKSFQNALIVYFKQLLTKDTRQGYQNYVELTLKHLNQCAILNRKGSMYKFTPSFWQVLVCASNSLNSDTREQYHSYWMQFETDREIPNYWRAKQIIFETWKRIDEGEDTTWMEMIREWDIVTSLA